MFDLTLATLITRILAALPIIAVHGFSLALVAKFLGDHLPQRDGRLSANPFNHLEVVGLLGFILLGVGWIRPIPLQLNSIRGKYLAIPLLVIGGLLPVVVLGALAVYLLPWAATAFSFSTAPLIGGFLAVLARLAIGSAIFNLLPLPPFSCAHIIAALRADWSNKLQRFQLPAGIAILAIGAFVPPSIAPTINAVLRALFGNISMLAASY